MSGQPQPRQKLAPPNGHRRVLLHSCCAPCSGEVMEAMSASDIEYTIYFYNPNIHPREEYELRKQENIRFAEQMNTLHRLGLRGVPVNIVVNKKGIVQAVGMTTPDEVRATLTKLLLPFG